jgi:hypothetical protein
MENKEPTRTKLSHFSRLAFCNNSDSEELYVNRFPRNAVARENKIKASIQTLIENRKELLGVRDSSAGPRRIRCHSVIDFEMEKIVSYTENLKILKKIKLDVIVTGYMTNFLVC